MTSKQEYTGKSVDEAICKACEALKLTREELDIEIISTGSTGIFGFCLKKAKIRVSKKSDSSLPKEEKPTPSKSKKDRDRKDDEDEVAAKTDDSSEAVLEPEIIETAKDGLLKVLDLMNFSATVQVTAENSAIRAHIEGENIKEIIGDEGQVLDSIQYLLRKILSKKFMKKIMISVDAGDYRSSRRQELEAMALRLAGEVKNTGRSRTVPALNPAERRIIHMAIQDDRAIRSRSVGDGIFKKVIIFQPGKNQRKTSSRKRGRNPRPRA